MRDPVDLVIDQLDAHGLRPKRNGRGWASRCPAHDDRNPSLSIASGQDGRALVSCHVGCDVTAIVDALGITIGDLFSKDRDTAAATTCTRNPIGPLRWPVDAPDAPVVAGYGSTGRWVYTDAQATALGVVFRLESRDGKTYRQASRTSEGWTPTAMPEPRPLYRLDVLTALVNRIVVVVEGEKCADALLHVGIVATCSIGGAKAWRKTDWSALRGRRIIVWPDADAPGRRYGDDVAAHLLDLGCDVKIVDAPSDAPAGWDAFDATAAGGDTHVRDLLRRARRLATREPGEDHDDGALSRDAGAAVTVGDWPDLVSLDAHEAPPPFPLDALPDWVSAWVRAMTEGLQVPADLPAMLALGVLAAVVQRSANVQVRTGWLEPLALFVVVAMRPGTRKSAVFRAATEVISQWETEQAAAMRSEIVAAQARRAAIEKEQKSATADDAAALAVQADSIVIPVAPQVITDDVTPAELGKLLAAHQSITVMAAEGCGLVDVLLDHTGSSKGTNYTKFLQGHAGDRIRDDRSSRDGVRIENPRLSVVATTQPDTLRSFAAVRQSRSTGLLARFLFVLPRCNLGERCVRPAPVPAAAAQEYDRAMRRLLDVLGPAEVGTRHLLRLSTLADDRVADFQSEIEPQLREGGDLDYFSDWTGKLAGLSARLAGLLHVATHSADPAPWNHEVSEVTTAKAITIARYLLAHAVAAFDLMAAPAEVELARQVWRRIETLGTPTVTKRDLHRAMQGRAVVRRAADLDPALQTLVDRGYLRRVKRTNAQDNRSEPYDVRPFPLVPSLPRKE